MLFRWIQDAQQILERTKSSQVGWIRYRVALDDEPNTNATVQHWLEFPKRYLTLEEWSMQVVFLGSNRISWIVVIINDDESVCWELDVVPLRPLRSCCSTKKIVQILVASIFSSFGGLCMCSLCAGSASTTIYLWKHQVCISFIFLVADGTVTHRLFEF